MIVTLLLVLIYLAFISLGLPDSLLGVSWPVMQVEWSMSTDSAGIISMILVCATIVSSLLSGKINRWLGTGKVVFISCLMTGAALLGISFAPSFYWIIPLAIPLGFGGGSVDAALNNYVATHYKAHHMNWLHSFWGVGATLGPIIMAQALMTSLSWRAGYRTVAIIQLSLAAILLISLPLWYKQAKKSMDKEKEFAPSKDKKQKKAYKIKGVILALCTFAMYCTIESAIGLWGSTYLVQVKNIDVNKAATWIAAYFAGITAGRFLCGFISFKLSNIQLIRSGMAIVLLSTMLLMLPLQGNILIVLLVLLGLGLAPIFPAMIHETPVRFGKQNSQSVIGLQMASAYVGIAFVTPGIGVLMERISMTLLPFILVGVAGVMIFCSERLIRMFRSK